MTDLVRTVSELAAALSDRERELLLAALAPRARLAVVGMACRFPGAPDLGAFWDLLARGVDPVREVPSDRWDIDAWYDPDPDAPGRMVTRHAAFIDHPEQFDAGFFEISPAEARRMDPQQRLLLEVACDALEHAGAPLDRLHGREVGVFVGACSHDHDDLQPTPADAHTLTGGLLSVLAGRLSYSLGLQGPSLVVDTACSSSLVALHLACQSLQRGECELAIVAGVNLILAPEGSVRLSRMRALAPDGRCRTFDARASGYARGEGVGVVILKREADARRDRDRIWARVRGSAVNHDGRSSGLTAPSGLRQRDVIRRALADAGLAPAAVDHVEAHGTGTPLGDPIEVEALRDLFDEPGRAHPCVISSVKTNIGHLEAAAGVAGIIKIVLALAHEQIPRHLHFTRPSPRIDLGASLVVPTSPHPWPRGPRERVAGVSSFGISGTNAHVLLSEGPADTAPAADSLTGPLVLPLSARAPAALTQLARAYITLLRGANPPPLHALARAAALRRSHHPHRLAVVGDTHESLAAALESALAGHPCEHDLARRYTRGEPIVWSDVYPGAHPPVALPTYPWQRERHWFRDAPPAPSPAIVEPTPVEPTPPPLDRAALDALIGAAVRSVLGFAPTLKIPPNQDLRDLGMDSLLAYDLATVLTRDTGREVPNSFAWDYPTLASMTEALAALLGRPA